VREELRWGSREEYGTDRMTPSDDGTDMPARMINVWRILGVLLCVGLCLSQVGSVLANSIPRPKPGDIYVWDATSYTCNYSGPVWCVKDIWVNSARHFYLTSANYSTNQALTACAAGYHMASLWEILNVSKLVYDYDHLSAKKLDDSGWGPPSGWNGWVRTGYISSGDNIAGNGNCRNWSSVSSGDYGVSVRLSRYWEMAVRGFFPTVSK
jgi:hypothetical protein